MKTKKLKGGFFNFFNDINVQVHIQDPIKIITKNIKISKKSSFEDLIYKINNNEIHVYIILYNGKYIYINYDGFTITDITDDKSKITINLKDYDGKPIIAYKSDEYKNAAKNVLDQINKPLEQEQVAKIATAIDNDGRTYTFHRHGFSCNNLNKQFGKSNQMLYDMEDPSLTIYGILDILVNCNDDYKKEYNGFIFVSSLVRTWQTAILLHFSSENVNECIVISPYLKEEHGQMYDKGNMPLVFKDQIIRMKLFFSLLDMILKLTHDATIKNKITSILKKRITIVDPIRNITYILTKQDEIVINSEEEQYIQSILPSVRPTYVNQKNILKTNLLLSKKSYEPPITDRPKSYTPIKKIGETQLYTNPVQDISLLTTYYNGDSLTLFNDWLNSTTVNLDRVFAVCHSHTMQSILKQNTTNFSKLSTFDTNVWSFTYFPKEYKFEVNMGLQKPPKTNMNFNKEELCNIKVSTNLQRVSDPYVDRLTDRQTRKSIKKAEFQHNRVNLFERGEDEQKLYTQIPQLDDEGNQEYTDVDGKTVPIMHPKPLRRQYILDEYFGGKTRKNKFKRKK